jgi:putative two-component system response regulator
VEEATHKRAKILVVDDQEQNVLLLQRILEQAGYTKVTATTDPSQVVGICSRIQPDLILLDLHMPDPDGFELLAQLKPWLDGRWFPILVLTADTTPETKRRALAGGAKDFVTKPFDQTEVLLRIENLLEMRFLQTELRRQNLTLEQCVYERTEDLLDARLETLQRLALAAEYRDDDAAEHTQRIGRTAAFIARALGLDQDQIDLIKLAAPLHDVGKIGVPYQILLKPGKLDPEEFQLMTAHVNVGKFILSGSRSPVLRMAEQIALTHHERWDGSGYVSGLKGAEIPLAGRIVAVADVFDALTHDRPYKKAWPVEEAVAEVCRLSGTQFDPQVVDAFRLLDHDELVTPMLASARAPRALAAVP